MMGKIANVIRWVSTFAVGGNSACMRATTASTRCSVKIMSEFQSKNRSTSAEPRLVMEVTFCRPGTLFTASSGGLLVLLFVAGLVRGFFFLCARSFNLDLRVVRQRVAARTDYRITGGHAAQHLRKFCVAHAELDGFLVRVAIGGGNHYIVRPLVVLAHRRS